MTKHDRLNERVGFFSRFVHLLKRTIIGLVKTFGILVLVILILLLVGLGTFFAVPEFTIGHDRIAGLIDRFAPEALKLEAEQLQLSVSRPEGRFFAKHIGIDVENLCLTYEGQAVQSCFEKIDLGFSAGWGGKRLEGEEWWMPRLISIDPIVMLGGSGDIDLGLLPESEEPKEASQFDAVEFLRTEILPKWKFEGSRIELEKFELTTAEDQDFNARFDLVTLGSSDAKEKLKDGEALRATLHEFKGAGIESKAVIILTKPKSGLVGRLNDPWKLVVDGDLKLPEKRVIDLLADADIRSWRDFDFRAAAGFKGIPQVREVRLEGRLLKQDFGGKVSVKAGEITPQVRQVDFVNCGIEADVEAKTGALLCGPQTIDLRLVERGLFANPSLYRIRPEFELKITRASFGETKEADIDFNFKLMHAGILDLESKLQGQVMQASGEEFKYDFNAQANLKTSRFQRVVSLLSRTPFAVPAPLNVLDGPIELEARANAETRGGRLTYFTATRLNSKFQAVHLRSDGEISWQMVPNASPETSANASVYIDLLKLSAPRFDLLSKPPRFTPDSRFGPIEPLKKKKVDVAKKNAPATATEEDEGSGMNLRLRIKTLRPDSIQIATNLTQAPIPIDVNLIFQSGPRALENQSPGPSAPVSAITDVDGTISGITLPASETGPAASVPLRASPKSELRGYVAVGQVPVEIFRRKAVVQGIKVDFKEAGRHLLDGRIAINYLDYKIDVLLIGSVSDPQVRFESTPHLEDNEILSVLLFGRPLNELDEDQQSSVSSMNAAFTDAVLGLTSLYFLASTPIESVGYDPSRGMVVAKVGLGGGASLEFGKGGEDVTGVGFRKRLSSEWSFRTDVERLGTTGDQTISALLEWMKRF